VPAVTKTRVNKQSDRKSPVGSQDDDVKEEERTTRDGQMRLERTRQSTWKRAEREKKEGQERGGQLSDRKLTNGKKDEALLMTVKSQKGQEADDKRSLKNAWEDENQRRNRVRNEERERISCVGRASGGRKLQLMDKVSAQTNECFECVAKEKSASEWPSNSGRLWCCT
jgi:hypothetical protein